MLKNNETIECDKANNLKLLQQIEELKAENARLETSGKELERKYEARINEKENENLDLCSKVNILKDTNIELDSVKLVLQEKEAKLAEAENLLHIKNKEFTESLQKSEDKYLQLSTEHKQLQETLNRDAQALRATLDAADLKLRQKETELEVRNLYKNVIYVQ